MAEENYDKKVMQLSAYCALQSKLLRLYDSDYNDIAMLKEISPLATKALRKRRDRNLRSLEDLSEGLDERILKFERQKPDIFNSQEAKELRELLEQRKREYKELDRDSQNSF